MADKLRPNQNDIDLEDDELTGIPGALPEDEDEDEDLDLEDEE